MKIGLRRACISCIIGCEPFEREQEQEVLIDIEYNINTDFGSEKDAIRYTISYVDVFNRIKAILIEGKFQLLEVAASVITQKIFSLFPAMDTFKIILVKKISNTEIYESFVEHIGYNKKV